jgi:Tfp pilus assembly protein PilF
MPSLDQLLTLLQADPTDTFLQYAVAMEHAKQGHHAEALQAFNALLAQDPNYVAAYFMAGRTCEQNADNEAAKSFYRQGIATAQKIGDTHAASEMSSALLMLE